MLKSIKTPRGDILLEEKEAGKLYFGGVEESHPTYYGYKFLYYSQPTYPYIWKSEIARMWDYVFSNETDEYVLMRGTVMLEVNSEEAEDFHIIFSTKAIDNLYDRVLKICDLKEGVPVSSIKKKNELEFYGKKCIIVSETLEKIFERKFGTFEDVKRSALNTEYKLIEIDEHKENVLNDVVKRINEVYSFATRDRIKVVAFVNNNIYGLHGTVDGVIYLNHETIDDIKELWITLAHEFSHDFGEDGSKAHLDAVQIILAECLINKGEHNDPS